MENQIGQRLEIGKKRVEYAFLTAGQWQRYGKI